MQGLNDGASNEHILKVDKSVLEALDKAKSIEDSTEKFQRQEEALRRVKAEAEGYKNQIAELGVQLEIVTQEAADFESKFEALKEDSGVTALEQKLEGIQEILNVSAKEFENWLKSVNLLKEGDYIEDFDKLYEKIVRIKSGIITNNQAIAEVKQELPHLLDQGQGGSGGIFDSQMWMTFKATLDEVLTTVRELSTAIADMRENGVRSIDGVVGNSGGTRTELEQVDAAVQSLSEDARQSYDAIVNIVNALGELSANADGRNLSSLSSTFRSISEIGTKSFGDQKVNNIIKLVSDLQRLTEASHGGFIGLDFSGISNLKVSKAALRNLADYLPTISTVNVDNLKRLSEVQFDNLSNLKVDKGSVQSIAEFVNAINSIQTQLSIPKQITNSASGGAKTSTKDYKEATAAIKEYYSLLQKMYATGTQGRYYRDNISEQNGVFVAKEGAEHVQEYISQLNSARMAMEFYRDQVNELNLTEEQRNNILQLLDDLQSKYNLKLESSDISDATRQEKERSDVLREAGELLEKMIQLREEYNGKLKVVGSDAFQNNEANIAALQELINGSDGASVSVDALKAKLEELKGTTDSNASSMKTLAGSTNSLASGISRYFAMMFSGYRIVTMAVREIKQMVSTATELDSAMTQLQIVTKASDATMQQFGQTAAQVAKDTATSITDVLDSATVFARLGYSLDESAILSKYTGMLQRVGDIEVGDAQDAITAIIKAYDIDASKIESVMDKLVEVGNNFPISVSQIAEGMNNASSSLAAAGNSFDQSVALLTAANTVVQNASKASTGLRTIAARLRNTKAELDELGEEPIATPKYEELVQQLTQYNVSLLDTAGNYRSTYDIMKDLAAVWDDITPNIQAAITTALAGTRQQAIFNSIIDQFQEASGAMDAMADSAGALSNAYDIYMDSTQAHIDQFKAAFQELSQTAIDSGLISDAVDKGTALINLLTKISGFVDTIGGLRTVLLSVVGVILTLKITTWTDKIQKVGRAIKLLTTDFSTFGAKLKENGMSMLNVWTAVATAVIVAITSIVSAIKKQREEQALAVKSAYESAFKEAKEGDAVFDAFEKYSDAKLAIDDNATSKAKLTQSTLELAKAIGIETSAISGAKNELEELSKLELDEAIRKAEEAVSAAQSVLFQNTSTGLTASNNQKLLRQYAVGYFTEAAKASGYTELWDGNSANFASDFAAWFENSDPERRVEAIRRVYEYMKNIRTELERAAGADSSILTSTEYTNVVGTISYLESDLHALDDAEALLAKRHEQYTKIVDRLASAAQRTRTAVEGSVAPVSAFAETAQLLKDSLGEAWELEDFAKTREELSKLAGEVNGITPDKITELAQEGGVLAVALQQDGMDARFLAHVLQSELTGGPGLELITEDALALNKALNGLSDEFDDLSVAKSRFDAASSAPEKDAEFRSMADAYKALNEEFEKGAVNSNKFWAAAEYLYGEAQLEAWGFSDGLDQIYEATQKNATIFQDAESSGKGFLERLKEIADEDGRVIGEDGGLIATIKELEDGSINFNIDDLRLDELAKKMGVSKEAIVACEKALSKLGRVNLTDMTQVLKAIRETDLGSLINGQTVVNYSAFADSLRNLGYNAAEIYELKQSLLAMDDVTLVDVNASAQTLTQSFIDLGVAEENAGHVTINIDGLLDLIEQLGIGQEDATLVANTLKNVDGIRFTNAEGSAVSLGEAVSRLNDIKTNNAKTGVDRLGESASTANAKMKTLDDTATNVYNDFKNLFQTSWNLNIGYQSLQRVVQLAREYKNLMGGSASQGSKYSPYGGIPVAAKGTKGGISGPTLTGEEDVELLVSGDSARLVGVHGPEIVNLKPGDQVYSGQDTKKILKNVRFLHGTIPALSGGTTTPWKPSSSASSSSAAGLSSGGASRASASSSSSSASKAESAFEKAYKEHQHLLKMDAETTKDYLTWLNDAYQKAYENNEIELDDYRKYREEVYQGMKDLFMDYLSDIEHEIDMIGEDKSRVNRIVELYSTAVKAVEKEVEAARKNGLKDTDDYIQQLQKKMRDYQKEMTSMREEALQEYEDSEQELVDLRIKMIKQEIDDRKDGLNKQLSDLKDFYQKQKDMLRDSRDEEKYLDDQAEKRKKIADIERELSALQRDNSAWAAKRRLELEQNLADARKDLREFEKDHAIEMAEEELDRISELREQEINGQIEDLENITPHELYEQALYDIRHATNELFNESVEWNNIYGDGIEKNIISMWERAKESFEDYWNTVRALSSDGDSTVMRFAGGFIRELQPLPTSGRIGYASGTISAAPGLHVLDEFGSETIFQSKNGQKYKMFTGGEKVLNAKASEFLYKFATSGGEFLSKLVNGAANGLNYLTGGGRRLAVEAVNMGDVIINGNADRSTVSEIRRAQRDALENLLHEFDRLSR